MNDEKAAVPLPLLAIFFAGVVTAISWLSIAPDSPFESSLGAVGAVFSCAQILDTILAMLLSHNVHGGALGERIYRLIVFGQWFIVGFGVLAIFKRRSKQT